MGYLLSGFQVLIFQGGSMSKELLLQNKDLQKETSSKNEKKSAFLLGIIVLLGIALRIYNLGTESYWIDEMSTVVEGQQNILQVITSGRLDQPPAYYLPFHLWLQVFGTSEASTRLFSAIVGVGSIMLIYLIGRELFTKEVGLFAAFLMAISEFQIYHSQQARFYSFFEFSTLLSFLFFIRVIYAKRRMDFILYAGASILMVYSHAYGLFVLAAQAMFLIFQWRKYRDVIAAWIICQVVIFLAVIPYFSPLIFGGSSLGGSVDENIGGLSVPLLQDPIRSLYRFVMSARGERSWETMLINYAVAALLFVVGVWIYAVKTGLGKLVDSAKHWFVDLQEVQEVKSKFFLVSCWLLCPILLPFIFSFLVSPMYLDRYTISAAPALYLILGLAFISIRKVVPTIISLGVITVMIAPSLGYYYATDVHEQWKEVALYVEENASPDDVIVFAPNLGIGIQQKTFNWYYQGTLQECGLGVELVNSMLITDSLMKCVAPHDRIWVIIRDNQTEPSYRYTSYFLKPDQTDMHLIDEHHFVEISAYLFELSK
jgi:mannosyltransferase